MSQRQICAIYASFLTGIEPTERPFHAADVPARLANAAAEAERVPAAHCLV